MLLFWVWAPVVMFVVIAAGVSIWAARNARANRSWWRCADRSARRAARALRLPRQVL